MIGSHIETNIAGGLDFPLPRMVDVRQKFSVDSLADVGAAIAEQFRRPEVRAKIAAGMKIAVGCGSRGVVNYAAAARAVVQELKALGAEPFIFPSMGSHGAATAEGQRAVLERAGITEAFTGAPIRASMETVILGELANGTKVHMDRLASEADGVVLINRIKPHTSFRAPTESGITKMMTIGMGKIVGAASLHTNGIDRFPTILPEAARLVMSQRRILLGVGLVENAADETAIVEVMPTEQIFEREIVLQDKAKTMMARLLIDEIDCLVIDAIGKNISGAGADPNVTGRNRRSLQWVAKPRVQKIVMLGLTDETKGNATGVGSADVITMRLFREIDPASTYANVITSTYLDGAAIPMVMNTDREAIALALKTLVRVKLEQARVVRIPNTLHLTRIQVSEAMLPAIAADSSRFEILGDPALLRFDGSGRIVPIAH